MRGSRVVEFAGVDPETRREFNIASIFEKKAKRQMQYICQLDG